MLRAYRGWWIGTDQSDFCPGTTRLPRAGLRASATKKSHGQEWLPSTCSLQAKDGSNAIDILRPEVKGEEIEYWVVKDTRLTDYYDWQTVQESWTDYEGKEVRAQWSRCSCQLPDDRLEPVVSKLTEFGFLPIDFRFNGASAESRKVLVASINEYALSRNLEMLLEKRPFFVVVPLQVLEDLDLEFVKTKEWAFIRG